MALTISCRIYTTPVNSIVSTVPRPLGAAPEKRLLPRQFFPLAYVVHLALLWAVLGEVPWTA